MAVQGPYSFNAFVHEFIVTGAKFDPNTRKQEYDALLARQGKLSVGEIVALTDVVTETIALSNQNRNSLEVTESDLFKDLSGSNIFQAILTHGMEGVVFDDPNHATAMQDRLMGNLFRLLLKPLSELSSRFFKSKITTRDYYDTFFILGEKITTLRVYGKLYPKDMIEELKRRLAQSSTTEGEILKTLNELDALLTAYRSAFVFLCYFNKVEEAEEIRNQAEAIITSLSHLLEDLRPFLQEVNYNYLTDELLNFQNDFNELSQFSMLNARLTFPWLSLFGKIDAVQKALRANSKFKLVENTDNELNQHLKKFQEAYSIDSIDENNLKDAIEKFIPLLLLYVNTKQKGVSSQSIELIYRYMIKLNLTMEANKSVSDDFAKRSICSMIGHIKTLMGEQYKQSKLQSSPEIERLAGNFFEVARKQNTAARREAVQKFILENDEGIKKDLPGFKKEVFKYFKQVDVVLVLSEENSTLFPKLNRAAEEACVLHELRDYLAPRAEKALTDDVRQVFCRHLIQTIDGFIRCFNHSRISEESYFFTYQTLDELMEWMDAYLGLYQKDLVSVIKDSNVKSDHLASTLEFLSDFLCLSMEFRRAFSETQAVQALSEKANAFSTAIVPFIGIFPTLQLELVKIQLTVEKVRKPFSPKVVEFNNVFNSFHHFFKRLNNGGMAVGEGVTLPLLRQQAESLKEEFTNPGIISLQTIQSRVVRFLDMVGQLRKMENQALGSDYALLHEVGGRLFDVMKTPPVIKFNAESPGDRKKIALRLRTLAAALKVPLQKLIEELKEKSLTAHPSEDDVSKLGEAVAALAFDDNLQTELSKKDAAYQTKVGDLKERHTQILKAREEENQRRLAERDQQYAAQLDTLVKEQAVEVSAKVKQLQRALDSSRAKLEVTIKDTQRAHTNAIEALKRKYRKDLAALTDSHKAELKDVRQKHKDELAEYKQKAKKQRERVQDNHQSDLALENALHRRNLKAVDNFDPCLITQKMSPENRLLAQALLSGEGVLQLNGLIESDYLNALFPGLGLTKSVLFYNQSIKSFWEYRLSQSSSGSDAYYLLALFMLLPMSIDTSPSTLSEKCDHALAGYFGSCGTSLTAEEKDEITEKINQVMENGLNSEFNVYIASFNQPQLPAYVSFMPMMVPPFLLPGYGAYRALPMPMQGQPGQGAPIYEPPKPY